MAACKPTQPSRRTPRPGPEPSLHCSQLHLPPPKGWQSVPGEASSPGSAQPPRRAGRGWGRCPGLAQVAGWAGHLPRLCLARSPITRPRHPVALVISVLAVAIQGRSRELAPVLSRLWGLPRSHWADPDAPPTPEAPLPICLRASSCPKGPARPGENPPSAGWLRGEQLAARGTASARAARPQCLPSKRALCAKAGGARRARQRGSGAADPAAAPPSWGAGGRTHMNVRTCAAGWGAGTRGLWEEAPARPHWLPPRASLLPQSHSLLVDPSRSPFRTLK